MKRIFPKTADTGLRHGTVTVITDGIPVEVTTFRTEDGYSDCRRPDAVHFVGDIKEDLARRDFTVNAICYNPQVGIIDLFGGINDIQNRILRTVGDPKARFSEDALRIMRLFRFATVIGFDIEPETLIGALKCADGLKNVSRERIAGELIKTVCGTNPTAALPLFESGALSFIGIKKGFSAEKLTQLEAKKELRLFAVLNESCDELSEALNRLKFGNAVKNHCLTLKQLFDARPPKTRTALKGTLSTVPEEIFSDYISFLSVYSRAEGNRLRKEYTDIIQKKEPYRISHLALTGDDLKTLGLSGIKIGEALEFLLTQVITAPEKNRRSILINLLNNR